MNTFKSAVTNYFNLPHWLYTLVILYIIFFYYLFIIIIYYYYCCFFLFFTFTVIGKNRKALNRLSQSCCGTFLTLKCHFGCKSFRISIELSYFICPKPLCCIKYLLLFYKKPNKSIASSKYCYCFFIDILSLVKVLSSLFWSQNLLSL